MAFAIGGAMIIIAAFFHIFIAFVPPDSQSEVGKKEQAKVPEKNKLDV